MGFTANDDGLPPVLLENLYGGKHLLTIYPDFSFIKKLKHLPLLSRTDTVVMPNKQCCSLLTLLLLGVLFSCLSDVRSR